MNDLLRKLKRFIEIKPNPKELLNYLLNKISRSGVTFNYCLGMPHRLFLEVTNSCNLNCALCPTGKGLLRRKKTQMRFADFKKIIDQMKNYLIEIEIGGFGEPFLNEDIYRMLGYIKNKGIFVEIYTNFLTLDKEGIERLVDFRVDKLVISLDAWDADSYLRYKGIDGFSKVVANLKYLVDIRKEKQHKKPLVNLQFIMIKDNLSQIDEIRKLAEEIGVDILVLKTPNLYLGNSNNCPNLELEKRFLSPDFNRYRFINGLKILSCPWVWDSLIIYVNGDVGPCCYDAQGDYILGNVFSENIGDIWNNKRYKGFRKSIIHNTNNHKLCTFCVERRKGAKIKIEYSINKSRL